LLLHQCRRAQTPRLVGKIRNGRVGSAEFASPAMEIKNLLRTHTADLGPDLEFSGSGSSVLGGGDMIAAGMEEVVDFDRGLRGTAAPGRPI